MIYLQPRKKNSTLSSRSFLIGGGLFVILLAVSFFASSSVQRFVHTLLGPVWALEQGIFGSSGTIAALASDRKKLLEENTHLELSLIEARQESVLVKELFRQNNELKQLLGRIEGREQIVAAVIARPPRLAYDTLVIDVGASHGIEPGSHVFVLGDIIIGEVSAVYPSTSLVALYSTAGRETDVLVGGVSAVAYGRGGGNYVIELPRDLQVATGTVVSIPGMDVSLFGVVENVVAHPADPVQKLYFRNPYALSTLTFVTLDVEGSTRTRVETSPLEIELP